MQNTFSQSNKFHIFDLDGRIYTEEQSLQLYARVNEGFKRDYSGLKTLKFIYERVMGSEIFLMMSRKFSEFLRWFGFGETRKDDPTD